MSKHNDNDDTNDTRRIRLSDLQELADPGDDVLKRAIANEIEVIGEEAMEVGVDPLLVSEVMDQYSRELLVSVHRNAVRQEMMDDTDDGDEDGGDDNEDGNDSEQPRGIGVG